jgi:hypothetical protein
VIENEKLLKDKLILEEKNKNLEFKIIDRHPDVKNHIRNKDDNNLNLYPQNFDPLLGIKNFTNFGVIVHKNSDQDFNNKKYSTLEPNLKNQYINSYEDKMRIIDKSNFNKKNLNINQLEDNYRNNFNDSNGKNLEHRKKILNPIINKSETSNINDINK